MDHATLTCNIMQQRKIMRSQKPTPCCQDPAYENGCLAGVQVREITWDMNRPYPSDSGSPRRRCESREYEGRATPDQNALW